MMQLSPANAGISLTIRITRGNPPRKPHYALHYQQYYRKLDSMMQKGFPELDESGNAVPALRNEKRRLRNRKNYIRKTT